LRVLAEESTCWICGGSDFVALKRHRRSPSVDHVEPLVAGGRLLARSNLRLAHYGCNSSRGARATSPGQLFKPSEVW
jgi:5-methylcytosine-specific restriction endonuclease McrA